jgi:hypothetical protein
VIGSVPIGQAPQAVNYVPGAVPTGDGTQNLQPLGIAGQTAHLTLQVLKDGKAAAPASGVAPTSVSLFDQGLTQVLQASATGLQPKQPYVLALSGQADGGGALQPLAAFMTNPAGSAIVNALGPIRQFVQGDAKTAPRFLVIAPGTAAGPTGAAVQIQAQ